MENGHLSTRGLFLVENSSNFDGKLTDILVVTSMVILVITQTSHFHRLMTSLTKTSISEIVQTLE